MSRPLAQDGTVRMLARAVAAAPSIHNTQPWRLAVTSPELAELRADPDRVLWVADPRGRALNLSCGAALLNLRLAIRMAGCRALIWAHPRPSGDPMLVASIQLAPGRPPSSADREMFEVIEHRHTSRAPFDSRRIPDSVRAGLEQAAADGFADLRMLRDREAAVVLDEGARAGKELAADFDHRVELARWVAPAAGARDGIGAGALGFRPDRAPAPVRDFSYAAPAAVLPAASFEPRPQLAVLSTASDEPADWLRAGQALQRVLLAAARYGLSASLLYQPIELHDMRHDGEWWPWPGHPQMIIRLGYGPSGPPTPRRPVDDILHVPLAGESVSASGARP